jgi:hypothetical protein
MSNEITRRTALAFLGTIAAPCAGTVAIAAAQPALPAETQEKKCRRLIGELMAEMAKLPLPLETMGGPAVDLSDMDRGEHIRFSTGRADDPEDEAVLIVVLRRPMA